MDFMKLLRSFEEFLFEATSWLVFYPLTLWRVLVRPLETMAYSDAEQGDDEEGRYDDALTPPLFLLITVVLMNLIATAAHLPREIPGGGSLQHAILGSPQNAALFRALIFSLIPLIAALLLLHRQGVRLSRASLRPPFYAQCYLASPCAVIMIGGGIIFQRHDIPNVYGLLLMLAGLAWFLTAQTRWFAVRLRIGPLRAAGLAIGALLLAMVAFVGLILPVALF
ncbi:hypothetical protein [Caulobacter sp.]|uniref:hypothetical protein n=1 Tax=Caulobacter sp. TaxID=78 RepID=UPI003BAF9491